MSTATRWSLAGAAVLINTFLTALSISAATLHWPTGDTRLAVGTTGVIAATLAGLHVGGALGERRTRPSQ